MAEKPDKSSDTAKSSRLRKILLNTLVFLFLFILFLPIIIHINPVQKFILKRVTNQIEKSTGSEVDIAKVNFSVLKGVILKDIYLSDPDAHSDTLAYIGEFSTSLEQNFLSLLDKRIHINDINLFEARLKIHKELGDDKSNLELFLSKLINNDSDPKSDSAFPLDLNLRNINLRNLQFSLDDEEKQSTMFASLYEGHIGVRKLDFANDSILINSISLLRPEFIMAEMASPSSNDSIVQATIDTLRQSADSGQMYLNIALMEVTEGAFQRVKSDSLINTGTGTSLDVDDLDVRELNFVGTDIVLEQPMSVNATIESLSLEEHNGLVLEDLVVDSFVLNDSTLLLKDLLPLLIPLLNLFL